MTIASAWYDSRAEVQREFEMHFKVARRGKIRTVRRRLARRGIPYFQREAHREIGRWIPKSKIRVSFEREEPAMKSEREISVTVRSMQYRGKHRKAAALPFRVINYAKKKDKSTKRRRAKDR
ncbi:MAG: hypothetical protein ACHQ03_07885 [Candidatus Bathyarchaeia archaeon]